MAGSNSFTMWRPFGSVCSARTPVAVRVSVNTPSPWTDASPSNAITGTGAWAFKVATLFVGDSLLLCEIFSGYWTSSISFNPPPCVVKM